MVLRSMIEIIKNNPEIFNPTNDQKDVASFGLGLLCLLLIGFLIYGSMGVTQQITNALIGAEVSTKFQENMIKALDKIKGWVVKGLGALISQGTNLMPQNVIDT